MRIDILGLQGFLSLADHGSFQQAAAHLNISQTALTHRIKKFEIELGMELFARTTRKVNLTAAGNRLVPHAKRILEDLDSTFRQVRSEGPQGHRLVIGCIPTIAVQFLSRAIAEFHQMHPEMSVKVVDSSATDLSDQVHAGSVDFAITVLRANRPNLEFHRLLNEDFVVLCRSDDPIARGGEVRFAELNQLKIIRNIVAADALGARAAAIPWRFEAENVTTAISMVEAGLGITIIPRFGAKCGPSTNLSVLRLRPPMVSRTLGILRRQDVPISGAGRRFTKILSDLMNAEHLPRRTLVRGRS